MAEVSPRATPATGPRAIVARPVHDAGGLHRQRMETGVHWIVWSMDGRGQEGCACSRYRGIAFGIGLCGALTVLGAASAAAGTSPFVGRWHWNRAESRLPPDEPPPSDMMAEFSRVDAAHVRWKITVTDAQGQQSVERFDTPANGEPYPVNSDTTASFRVGQNTLHATFAGPAGQSDALACTVSADQRKMTCSGTVTGSDGKTASYVDVYDRH